MQLLYKNKKAKVQFDANLRTLIIDYFGVFNEVLIQEAFANSIVENTQFIIGDLSKMAGSFYKLMNYFDDKYLQLKNRGIIGQVLIISDDLIINNLVNKLESKIKKAGIAIFITTSREEAFEWVKNYNKLSK